MIIELGRIVFDRCGIPAAVRLSKKSKFTYRADFQDFGGGSGALHPRQLRRASAAISPLPLRGRGLGVGAPLTEKSSFFYKLTAAVFPRRFSAFP